jgi:hypothetical protein
MAEVTLHYGDGSSETVTARSDAHLTGGIANIDGVKYTDVDSIHVNGI